MIKNKNKVIIALSGGIDSAVAAALLKRAGFDVRGVFMKLVNLPKFKKGEKRAKKISKILGISFITLYLRKEFKKRVINYFLKEHKKGTTPNPCVVCNKEIKFGLFLEKTLNLNADYMATGHYVRKIKNPKFKIQKLLKGKDRNKDQSYFLWKLNQRQLRRILFPIGNYTKKEVKKIAKKLRLPVSKTSESQEICFIDKTINDFLRKNIKQKGGRIIDVRGKIIGTHQGLIFYTIGQRKGTNLSGGPFYVLDKNLKKNILIVTKNKKDLYRNNLIAKNINWISEKPPKLPLKVNVKIRYRQKASLAKIKPKNKNIEVIFNKPQRAITPGQSIVFYQGQELLGGGIIC
jgi:tRNA-specific 2-thiouridylase